MNKPAISVQREPNGRKQRDTRKQIEDAQREAAEKARAVTYGQPHRRGDSSQLCATSWGRFCLRNKLDRELFDAGERYGELYRRWMLVIGGRRVEGHTAGAWTGTEPAPEMIRRLEDELFTVERSLRIAGAYPLIRHMVIDCPTEDMSGLTRAHVLIAIRGAEYLAHHFYGRTLGLSPFV